MVSEQIIWAQTALIICCEDKASENRKKKKVFQVNYEGKGKMWNEGEIGTRENPGLQMSEREGSENQAK